ncbi:MAG: hypothetical protein IJ230_04135 [Clostridia bacterium]|nr:hypothetical protein [Clostridia bacterium]
MDIKLMCLGNEISAPMATAQKTIENDLKAVFDGDFKFTNYGSEKEFIRGLSEAIENDDILVLSCQPELYTAFKSFVADAFTFKARPVKAIQRLIQEAAPSVSSETILNHSLIPVDADAILSQDGLYSGYAMNSDDQILVVLPLDASRIEYLLEDGLFPYLRDTLDIGEFVDDPLKGITGEADGVAVGAAAAARAEEAAEAAAPEAPVKKAPYDAAGINDVICRLRDKGLTVAVATTKTVDFLKSISETVNMDRVIFLSPYTFAKNEMKADEYAVKLAKGAFDTSEATLGASLTKVFSKTNEDGSKSYYMYASISDGKTANQAKITAKPGDTPPQLIYKSIEVLFRMMDLWSNTGYAEPQYTEEAVVDEDFSAEHPAADVDGKPVKDEGDKRKSVQKTVATALIGASAIGSAALSLLANNLY